VVLKDSKPFIEKKRVNVNCPKCTTEMVKVQVSNFSDPYDYCRACKKELSELIKIIPITVINKKMSLEDVDLLFQKVCRHYHLNFPGCFEISKIRNVGIGLNHPSGKLGIKGSIIISAEYKKRISGAKITAFIWEDGVVINDFYDWASL
jgi:hypothetical protein